MEQETERNVKQSNIKHETIIKHQLRRNSERLSDRVVSAVCVPKSHAKKSISFCREKRHHIYIFPSQVSPKLHGSTIQPTKFCHSTVFIYLKAFVLFVLSLILGRNLIPDKCYQIKGIDSDFFHSAFAAKIISAPGKDVFTLVLVGGCAQAGAKWSFVPFPHSTVSSHRSQHPCRRTNQQPHLVNFLVVLSFFFLFGVSSDSPRYNLDTARFAFFLLLLCLIREYKINIIS